MTELRVFPLEGIPEIQEGDDLAGAIADAAERAGGLADHDVVVVAQKVVSKAEGRIRRLADIAPSARAVELAGDTHDPRQIQAILDESARVVRERDGLVISETRHGFVCASAGVDASNAPAPGTVVLLPRDPDASARSLRGGLRGRTGCEVGVVITDSFGRAWRQGTTDVAIGAAGIPVLLDLKGTKDRAGYELHATVIAVADEIAGAAQLVMGKVDRIPAAVVRGLELSGDEPARDIAMPAERDLFR